MDPLTIRRAVEHLLVGLPLLKPNQLAFSIMSGADQHYLLDFDSAQNKLVHGWVSDYHPCEMAALDAVAGGNYTAWDTDPPALTDEELVRWEQVFNAIHTAVHNGKIVRFGADDGGFCATVEDEAGTGSVGLAVHLLWALDFALRR